MIPNPYNKPASQQGSIRHGQVIAPARGAACSNMDYNEVFEYHHTGEITWRSRPRSHFKNSNSFLTWNKRYAGVRAGAEGSVNEYGHRSVSLFGKRYLVHRVIWEMHNGPIPDKVKVDHRDGDATNNRIENLRLATNQENSWNSRRRMARDLPRGVFKRGLRYEAHINHDGKYFYLGLHDSVDEAYAAYTSFAVAVRGQFFCES